MKELENVIKNCPVYAYDCTAIVARKVNNEWWFWGAYNNPDEAINAMFEVKGEIFWIN